MTEITILEEGRKGDFYFLGGVLLTPPVSPNTSIRVKTPFIYLTIANLIWKCPRPLVRQSIFQNKD